MTGWSSTVRVPSTQSFVGIDRNIPEVGDAMPLGSQVQETGSASMRYAQLNAMRFPLCMSAV